MSLFPTTNQESLPIAGMSTSTVRQIRSLKRFSSISLVNGIKTALVVISVGNYWPSSPSMMDNVIKSTVATSLPLVKHNILTQQRLSWAPTCGVRMTSSYQLIFPLESRIPCIGSGIGRHCLTWILICPTARQSFTLRVWISILRVQRPVATWKLESLRLPVEISTTWQSPATSNNSLRLQFQQHRVLLQQRQQLQIRLLSLLLPWFRPPQHRPRLLQSPSL